MTTLDEVESATALIVSHEFPWCRARLLHALGAAEEQGILDEVLSELLGQSEEVGNLRRALIRHGWVRVES